MAQTDRQLPQRAGIGLRSEHYTHILQQQPDIPWFEVLTENYMGDGGMPLYYLDKIAEKYPISFHGVGMSLGSADPLNMTYMHKLKALIKRYQPAQVSDHLSWISVQQRYTHELLPFPYNSAFLQHLIDKISSAQDFLGHQILVENPSSYMQFKENEMPEWEFINHIIKETDCKLLLDINNVYVSAYNTDLDAEDYIKNINKDSVAEIHLAGFEDRSDHLYDTHGNIVDSQVWELYKQFIQRSGPIPSLLEWDTDIPEFEILQQEANKAQKILDQFTASSNQQALKVANI